MTKKLHLLDGKTACTDFDALMRFFEQITGRPSTPEEEEEAWQEWISDTEHGPSMLSPTSSPPSQGSSTPQKRAINADGQLTKLPAKPERKDFTDEETYREFGATDTPSR
jgi:hypothetical protein